VGERVVGVECGGEACRHAEVLSFRGPQRHATRRNGEAAYEYDP
jgi:hypothetical protein